MGADMYVNDLTDFSRSPSTAECDRLLVHLFADYDLRILVS